MELEKVFCNDYSEFKAGDFLADESFVAWVKHRGENRNLDLYWEMIGERYPGLKKEIEEAESMIRILSCLKVYNVGSDQAEAWKAVQRGISKTRSLRLLRTGGRFVIKHRNIAAVLLSLVIITGAILGGYFLRPGFKGEEALTTIYSPAGQRTEITLPDNSKVMLNSKTTLRYSSGFNTANREIYLDGEAYFDVRKGHLPFEVKTEAINIRVLGTAFNVKCYSDESVVEATLVRGSMIVEKLDGKSEVSEEIKLKPNQKVSFVRERFESPSTAEAPIQEKETVGQVAADKSSREQRLNLIESYDTQKSTGWIDGLLIIEGESLENLSKKIERRYDVSIIFMSEELKDFKYTGTLREYSLEQVMKALEATSPISYSVDKNKVYIGENKEKINKYLKLMK
jgi:ferric-dicitrate binding protein FerR (iron transport regulator)